MNIKNTYTRALFLLFMSTIMGIAAHAQTSVALSADGTFSNAVSNAQDTQDIPSNSAGAMIELRRIRNSLVGYEATYSFNRADQGYFYVVECIVGGGCALPPPVSANAHELSGDWLVSSDARKYRLFALGGGGLLLTVPTGGQSGTHSAHTAVYVYGVGVDWKLQSRIGLRFQYRGNIHRAPYISFTNYSTDPFQHTAEPMIGVYYKF